MATPLLTPIQTNFNGGELSPLLAGRIDLKTYSKGMKQCLNRIGLLSGALVRRPGTIYVTTAKNDSKVRLFEFIFSVTQACVLEFSNNCIRFIKDTGIILNGSTPYEVTTTYTEEQLDGISILQSADVVYIAHKDHPLRKLSRYSDTNWVLSVVNFSEPPWDEANKDEEHTMSVGALTGSNAIVTSSKTVFSSDFVGRFIRFVSSGTARWAKIITYTSSTQVTVTFQQGATLSNVSGLTNWRFNLNYTGNQPTCMTFSQGRLFLSGFEKKPGLIVGSVSSDFENFAVSSLTSNTMNSSSALSFVIGSDRVERIVWIRPIGGGVAFGTNSGEWVMRASTTNEALTYDNVKADRTSTYGSAIIPPITKRGGELLYVQSLARRICDFSYSMAKDNYVSSDLNMFANHILNSRVKTISYQQNPQDVVWCVLEDGTMATLLYDATQEVLEWTRHNTDGSIISMACIPSDDYGYDVPFIAVKRTINGTDKIYIERIAPFFDSFIEQKDAVFVDSSLSYTGVSTNVLTGLSHLEGKTVRILGDGAAMNDEVVVNGSITLETPVTSAVVGIPYISLAVLNNFEAGDTQSTTQDDPKRINRLTLRLWSSLGEKTGSKIEEVTNVVYRNTSNNIGQAVPLFTGDADVVISGDYDSDTKIFIYNDTAFPSAILASMAELKAY